MMSIFSWVYWPFVYLLWKNVYSSQLPIFKLSSSFLLLCCRSSSYVLDIHLLLDMWFAYIFCHSVGFLYTLLIVLLDVQKFFNFDDIYLIFLLLFVFSVSYPRTLCQIQHHEAFAPRVLQTSTFLCNHHHHPSKNLTFPNWYILNICIMFKHKH